MSVDPDAPAAEELRLVGQWPGHRRGVPVAAAVQNGIAYLAMGPAGIAVFDVKDPRQPRRLGDLPLPGGTAPRGIVVNDTRVVTWNDDRSVTAIDVVDPAHPRHVLTSAPQFALERPIDLRGDTVLVGGYDAGRQQRTLEVWDLFTSSPPTRLSVLDIPAATADWAFLGSRQILVAGQGIRVYDTENGSEPRLVIEWAVTNSWSQPVVRGSRVLLRGSTFGGLDLSDPLTPQWTPFPLTNWVSRMIWAGDTAWGVGEESLLRVNAADPSAAVTTFDPGVDPALGDLFAGDDSVLLVGNPSAGVQIFDLSQPGIAQPAARLNDFGDTTRVKIRDAVAYLADGPTVALLDVSSPSNPRLIDRLPPKLDRSERVDLDVRDDWLVWTDPVARTASFYSVTNGAAPSLNRVIQHPTFNPLLARFVGPDQVAVIERALPSSDRVTLINRFSANGWARTLDLFPQVSRRGLALAGSWETLYVAWTNGVSSAPLSAPSLGGPVLPIAAPARGLAARGPYVYVAADLAGLVIVESTPANPLRVVGSVVTAAPALDVAVRPPYAFVATGSGGIEVFDILDVAHPRRVAMGATVGEAQAIEMVGDHLFVSCGAEGVSVLEFRSSLREQTISFPPLFSRDFAGPPFRIPVTSSSGLPVRLVVLSGPAVVEGDLCRPTGKTGTVVLRAEQSGSAEYAATVAESRFSFPFLRTDLVRDWMLLLHPGAPATEIGGDRDPDRDGLNNRIEHLLGTDPLSASSLVQLSEPRLEEVGGRRYLVFGLSIQPDPVVSIDWTRSLRVASDLRGGVWKAVPAEWIRPEWDRVVFRIPVDTEAEGLGESYFRLSLD